VTADFDHVFRVSRAIHMARLRHTSFPGHNGYTGFDAAYMRQPWPEDRAEAMELFHAGQSWMDLAVAQAKAAMNIMRNEK
jgi:hypothetical protein